MVQPAKSGSLYEKDASTGDLKSDFDRLKEDFKLLKSDLAAISAARAGRRKGQH